MKKNDEVDFLWTLFSNYLFKLDRDGALDFALRIYEKELLLPKEIKDHIEFFIENKDLNELENAALLCLKIFFFDFIEHVILLSFLVEMNRVSIEDIVKSLTVAYSLELTEYPLVQEAMDLIWLINQDGELSIQNVAAEAKLRDTLLLIFKRYSH